jgi:hypothetical protein
MNAKYAILPGWVLVLLFGAVMASGCNMPQPLPSGDGASDASDSYTTDQQALQSQGGPVGCPRGRAEMWYLCLAHSISIHFFAPPGTVNFEMGADPCVGVPTRSGSVGVSGEVQELPITISGEAEDDDVRCTFTGQNPLAVSASGECRGSGTSGVETLSIDESWGIAQAELHCECKGESDCHPYNGPIALAGLGDQSITIEFGLNTTEYGDCRLYPMSGGPLSGWLTYCFQNSAHAPAPQVPLEPLVR